MSEYIVDALWMAEYERGIESLLGIKLEYDGNDNPTPPLPRRNIIVRCRDCEYMERQTTYDGSMSWFLCSHFKRPTRRDGYCAWGVRS